MSALYLLSEATNEPNLGWLLWLVLALFVVIVIIGWIVSKKDAGEAPEEKHVAPSAPASPDNLKKIEGVGPKVERVLNDAGISTFAELASASVEKLSAVLDAADLQMMDPSGWIEQADLAAKGDWDTLATLQEELKGGRRV